MIVKNRGALLVPEEADHKIMTELAIRFGIMNYGSQGYEIVLGGRSITFMVDDRITNFRKAVAWARAFEMEFGAAPRDRFATEATNEGWRAASWFNYRPGL